MAETSTTTTANSVTRPTVNFSFFFWMTLVMAFVVFAGFGASYFQPMAAGTLRPVAPIVHIHGVFYFAWMILLVVQSWLVNHKSMAVHRSMGLAGISIATGIVFLASTVTFLSTGKALAENPSAFVYELMYLSLIAIIAFSILFIYAINNIRDSEAHKRFILLATVAFLAGGLNRIFIFLFEFEFTPFWILYVSVDLIILAFLVYDWRTLGKLHRATILGAAINVVPQLLHGAIANSSAFYALTHWLVGFTVYS